MDKKFIVAVKGIVVHRGRILLVKRSLDDRSGPGEWEFAGGRIEFGETPEEALIREASEETGLKINIHDVAYTDSFVAEDTELIIIAYFCTCNTDSIILSNEHIDYKWVLPDKLCENVCDLIRPAVSANFKRIRLFAEAEKNLQGLN